MLVVPTASTGYHQFDAIQPQPRRKYSAGVGPESYRDNEHRFYPISHNVQQFGASL